MNVELRATFFPRLYKSFYFHSIFEDVNKIKLINVRINKNFQHH